jgi:hypothetical protein
MPKVSKKPKNKPESPSVGRPVERFAKLPAEDGKGEPGPELLYPEATSANRIRISRLDDFNKKEILHGYLNEVEQTEARIAELWGGGTYATFLLETNERGQWVVANRKNIRVLGQYKPPGGIYGLPTAPSGPPGTAGTTLVAQDPRIPPGSTARELVESALLGKVLDLMEQKNKTVPGFDWGPIITGALGLIQALVDRPRHDPQQSALAEELRQLRSEIERTRNQPGPATHSIADVLEAVEKIASARKLFGGGEDEERGGSPLTGLLAPILQLLAKGGQVSQPTPAEPRGNPPSTSGDPGPVWVQLLRHYGRDFVGAAQRNVEPFFVAEMALRFVPSEYEGVLFEFVQRPDAATAAMEVIPQLKQFPTWTGKVFEELRNQMQEGESEATVEGEEEEGKS